MAVEGGWVGELGGFERGAMGEAVYNFELGEAVAETLKASKQI
jgi:hypothetical protein